MVMTDPIADMLTRIRNANHAKHKTVIIPSSNIKKQIANILLEEGYIKEVTFTEDAVQGSIVITLKYDEEDNRVIAGLKRISKPGLRIYADVNNVPKVLNGLGMALISTSKGLMKDKKARELNIGGEVICYVW